MIKPRAARHINAAALIRAIVFRSSLTFHSSICSRERRLAISVFKSDISSCGSTASMRISFQVRTT